MSQDPPILRNKFGEVHRDHLSLYSHELGGVEQKGERIDLAQIERVSTQTVHPRDAITIDSNRFGHGRYFKIGLFMVGFLGLVMFLVQYVSTN